MHFSRFNGMYFTMKVPRQLADNIIQGKSSTNQTKSNQNKDERLPTPEPIFTEEDQP